MSFACEHCDTIFNNNVALGRHRKSVHGLSKVHKCDGCERVFNSAAAICHHRKVCLFPPTKSPSTEGLRCGLCEVSGRQIFDLCAHVREKHGIAANFKTARFGSQEEFDKWKSDVEERGRFEFTRRRTAKSQGKTKEYMYCHRSGSYSSQSMGLRMSKKKGSIKSGFTCSAFAFSTKDNHTGRITVTYCLTHYGHDDNLSRVRLPEDVRAEMADYIRENRSIDWILEKMRNDFDEGPEALNGSGFSRRHCITRDDVKNVAACVGLTVASEKSKDDAMRLWQMVREMNGSDNPFFFYNPQADDNPVFTLGIQTQAQADLLKEKDHWTICIDSSDGNQKFKLLLITILAIDEFGKGFPCAWLITSSDSERTLTDFFQALRYRCGQIVCDVFLSDNVSQYYRSWITAFCQGGTYQPPVKLLSTWHVRREWQHLLTKLRDQAVEQRAAVWHRLLVLLKERDRNSFDEKLRVVQAAVHDCEEHEFLRFFRLYCTPDRIKEWASWGRQRVTPRIDMFVEEFHNILREKFLDPKENRRLDAFVSAMLGAAKFFSHEYAVAKKRGRAFSVYHRIEMRRRHEVAMTIPQTSITLIQEDVWLVSPPKDPDRRFVVQVLDEHCNCPFRCSSCRVCPDMYACTCANPTSSNAACEHMHLVHIMRRKNTVITLDLETEGAESTEVPPAVQTVDVVAEEGWVDIKEEPEEPPPESPSVPALKDELDKVMSELFEATEGLEHGQHLRQVLSRVKTLKRFVDSCKEGGPPPPKRRRGDKEDVGQTVQHTATVYITRSGRRVINNSFFADDDAQEKDQATPPSADQTTILAEPVIQDEITGTPAALSTSTPALFIAVQEGAPKTATENMEVAHSEKPAEAESSSTAIDMTFGGFSE